MTSVISRHEPVNVSPKRLLDNVDDLFFAAPPEGHFWLEHLIRTIARIESPDPWQFFAVKSSRSAARLNLNENRYGAVYAVSTATRYAMFHATDEDAGAALLLWALEMRPPLKILSAYMPMEKALYIAELEKRMSRDHRELYLTLPLGGLTVEPDWRYRLATEADVGRLQSYNAMYNSERRTSWSRNWKRAVAKQSVYVRDRGGVISSCLLRGAILPPRVSFGGTFTFPEFRGLGEATMLVANFCAEMALSGLDVCLIVDDDNPAALRAYSKVGFIPAGLYRTTYF